jgi:hypothetical protein
MANDATQPSAPPPAASLSSIAPPPPPSLRRFGRGLLSALGFVITVSAMLVLYLKAPQRSDMDVVVGERFADYLCFGTSALPDDPMQTGYGAAFALLSDRKQAAVDALGLMQTFDDLQAQHGLLQAAKRLEQEGGRMRRRKLHFHLVYAGTEGEPVKVALTVTVIRDGREFRVDDYVCASLPAEGK